MSARLRRLPAAGSGHAAPGQELPDRDLALRAEMQAQRMEMVGRFAAGIAHDFNNLLAAILAATEQMAGRPELDATTREDAAQIGAAARRGGALVRQLLAFAREAPAAPRRLEVRAAIDDVLPLLRHLLGRGVRLVIERGDEALPVRIDPTGFDQVLLNLAANARDAMPRGGVLTLRCRSFYRDGTRVACIEVRDTGTGIAPEVLPHIFTPFFTTRSDHGTGLGLATVQEIITTARGAVSAESTPGAGTCMRVVLPIDEEPTRFPVCATEGRGLVLLVEDEPVSRRLAERALTSWGWQVVAAEFGRGGAGSGRAGPGHADTACGGGHRYGTARTQRRRLAGRVARPARRRGAAGDHRLRPCRGGAAPRSCRAGPAGRGRAADRAAVQALPVAGAAAHMAAIAGGPG